MIANTKLEEIQAELAPQFETVCLKGNGSSSFVYAAHNACVVEISEDNGRFWLEFWKNSDDEDATPAQQSDCESAQEAIEVAAAIVSTYERPEELEVGHHAVHFDESTHDAVKRQRPRAPATN